jgi:hypothetical protein
MCPPQNESDPLLTLPGKTASTVRKNKRKRQKRNFMLLAIALGVLAMVSVTMVVVNKASKDGSAASAAPSSILGRARAARSRVSFDEMTGQYTVNWETAASTATATATATNVGVSSSSSVITPSTTFSELAEIMLLPWYEASIIAVLDDPVWDVKKKGIDPDSIYAIRKVLLITRSMLDVFSPVFPDTSYSKKKKKIRNGGKSTNSNSEDDHSLWKKLRTLYRRGYQAAGELHDLKDLTYSKKLYKTRLDAVLSWKQDFVNFQKTHRIRRYLYSNFDRGFGGIDPNGCYYHKASHLFWADSSLLNLPCGDDSGTTSLRSLASVQLEHSLGYLEIIKNYTTVMPREHEVDFHNLRKELRIFVDECDLFGNVLVPDENETAVVVVVSGVDVDDHADDDESSTVTTTTSLEDTVELLRSAQEFLGAINDKWTAHDIYIQDDSHPKTRTKLAKETDEMWHSFLHWESKKDLKGTMERLLQRLNE